jgi:dTDP-4-dehydrorhamnose reductase
MPAILLFGRTGQVGWELQRSLASLGALTVLGHDDVDLGRPAAIRDAVRAVQPRLIVNAAAYTAVDKAEDEPDLAHAINGDAVGVMADEAKRLGAALVHYSTDYVFDGTATTPLTETRPVAPLNAYGRSKLAGEEAIRDSGLARHLIFRTCWVYADRGKNFLKTMQRLAAERDELRVVADQRGSPTWARQIAEATALVLAASRRDDGWEDLASRAGTYHLAAAGDCTWHDFATAIVAASPRADGSTAHVLPISTSEYPTPAKRPAYSVLDTDALHRAFGIRLPHWRQGLRLCLDLEPPPAHMA